MWKIEEIPKIYLTALCAWREARGCSVEAIRGVLHVIDNRARQGVGHVEVILKSKQFASFTPESAEATRFPGADDRLFHQILEFTEQVIMGQDPDLTGGATAYYDSSVRPDWAETMTRTAQMGTFVFLK